MLLFILINKVEYAITHKFRCIQLIDCGGVSLGSHDPSSPKTRTFLFTVAKAP